jgi:hypothetical protein
VGALAVEEDKQQQGLAWEQEQNTKKMIELEEVKRSLKVGLPGANH